MYYICLKEQIQNQNSNSNRRKITRCEPAPTPLQTRTRSPTAESEPCRSLITELTKPFLWSCHDFHSSACGGGAAVLQLCSPDFPPCPPRASVPSLVLPQQDWSRDPRLLSVPSCSRLRVTCWSVAGPLLLLELKSPQSGGNRCTDVRSLKRRVRRCSQGDAGERF